MQHAPVSGFRVANALLLSMVLGACAYAIPEVDPTDIPAIMQRIVKDTHVVISSGLARLGWPV